MGALKPWHIIVLVVVLILLFGAKRLPDAARALGRSLRIIKAETRGLADDDLNEKADAQTARAPLPQVPDSQPSPKPTVDPVQRVRDN
ncbi:MAG TPA: Sec-independent protein translocase subunit TatA [Micromonosporaceae bacterium]|nr:Sec-independent protein translocase subunit TatA [Micromonosporaceae bacterium]